MLQESHYPYSVTHNMLQESHYSYSVSHHMLQESLSAVNQGYSPLELVLCVALFRGRTKTVYSSFPITCRQGKGGRDLTEEERYCDVLRCAAVCCDVLRCAVVCCDVLRCAPVC